jgi:hypothetical protein
VNASEIEGIHTIRLESFTRHGASEQPVIDYRTPAGTIRVNGGRQQNATILVETGITDALIALETGGTIRMCSSSTRAGSELYRR